MTIDKGLYLFEAQMHKNKEIMIMWLNATQLVGGDVRNFLVRGEELKLKISEADFLRFSINRNAMLCIVFKHFRLVVTVL